MKHVWLKEGTALVKELALTPGLICLAAGQPGPLAALVGTLANDLNLVPTSVGQLLAACPQAPSPSDVERLLAGFQILYDLDILMWPALNVSVESLFRSLARRGPRIWIWPGTVQDGRARYSKSGRPDYHDIRLSDTIVLRPASRGFPDEMPYSMERIGS